MEKRGDSFWGFRNNPFIALASAFGDGRFVPASPFPWGLIAPPLLLYVVLVASPHGAGWIFVPVTLIGLSLISIFQPGLEFYLLMIFALVSWFRNSLKATSKYIQLTSLRAFIIIVPFLQSQRVYSITFLRRLSSAGCGGTLFRRLAKF